ncbi:MAG: L-rhamnose mutarotase [Cyclobacteriaceae bacterium]
MKTVAFKMHLRAGKKDEYKQRHDQVWPELKNLLKASGISNYHIFLDESTNTLFACQQVAGDHGSQDLANNPIVQKWWAHMADLMEVNDDNSPISTPLEEVFFME